MEKRYRALRLVSGLYKVLGAIVGIIALLVALATCVVAYAGGSSLGRLSQEYRTYGLGVASGVLGGVITGGLILLYGAFMAVTLYGTGELFSLFVDLEENTRQTAALLQGRSSGSSVTYGQQ